MALANNNNNNLKHAMEASLKTHFNEEQKRNHILNSMRLQDKWFEKLFYDKLIKKENDKLETIKKNSTRSKITLNKSMHLGLDKDLETQTEQIHNYLYQFNEIKNFLDTTSKEQIKNLIENTNNNLNLLVNIIIGLFFYIESEEEKIEIEKEITIPLQKSSKFIIMKTSGNQSDCLIHSILININEKFRKLTPKQRNTIAFFFRKIIFPLTPNIEEDVKNRLLTDPTITTKDLYLDIYDIIQIAIYYNINFIIINIVTILKIPYDQIEGKPFYIINHSGSHFSAIKVNNNYGIPYDKINTYFPLEGGYKSKKTKSKKINLKKLTLKRLTLKKTKSKKIKSKKTKSKKTN